jgi:hypothetical protein
LRRCALALSRPVRHKKNTCDAFALLYICTFKKKKKKNPRSFSQKLFHTKGGGKEGGLQAMRNPDEIPSAGPARRDSGADAADVSVTGATAAARPAPAPDVRILKVGGRHPFFFLGRTEKREAHLWHSVCEWCSSFARRACRSIPTGIGGHVLTFLPELYIFLRSAAAAAAAGVQRGATTKKTSNCILIIVSSQLPSCLSPFTPWNRSVRLTPGGSTASSPPCCG